MQDEISLAGSPPGELQELLDAFAAYCMDNALNINPSKCNIVVFSGGGTRPDKEWIVDYGHVVARVHVVARSPSILIGIVLEEQRSHWCDTPDHRLGRMTAALSAVESRLKELHISCDSRHHPCCCWQLWL